MSELIGPALPPGYTRRSSSPSGEQKRDAPEDGVSMPLSASSRADVCQDKVKCSFGPALPPDHELTQPTTDTLSSSFGPSLPPHTIPSVPHPLGPALPPGYKTHNSRIDEVSDHREHVERTSSGTSHPQSDEGGDPDMIGPMPAVDGDKGDSDRIKSDIESRSKYMRDKLLGKDSDEARPQREEWMTELPPEFKPLGIGPRKFRTTKSGAGDRSVWTDTPADRHRKKLEGGQKKKANEVAEEHLISARDREIAGHVDGYNKRYRSESLMELHRKRRAEESCNDEPTERRPFNRELDLEAPRSVVTPSKRRALVKDSRTALDKKFSRGTKSFL